MDHAALLSAIQAGGVNGAILAERLGVSRTAVWKAIQQLRAEGLQIEGAAGEGYRLKDGAGFGPHTLSWKLGRKVHFFSRCDSTNVEARRLATQHSEAVPTIVVADAQSAGRGRLGRQWNAEPGLNLLFSMVLYPNVPPQRASVCVLAWAAAMAEVLDCQVKWPNDLVTSDGKKLGGILAEVSAEAESVRFVVLGVGINVNQVDFPGLPHATSLACTRGAPQERANVLKHLVEAIDAVDTRNVPDLELWRLRSNTIGRRVRVGEVEGIATDVRDDGALLVDGTAILAGDVQMVGPVTDKG